MSGMMSITSGQALATGAISQVALAEDTLRSVAVRQDQLYLPGLDRQSIPADREHAALVRDGIVPRLLDAGVTIGQQEEDGAFWTGYCPSQDWRLGGGAALLEARNRTSQRFVKRVWGPRGDSSSPVVQRDCIELKKWARADYASFLQHGVTFTYGTDGSVSCVFFRRLELAGSILQRFLRTKFCAVTDSLGVAALAWSAVVAQFPSEGLGRRSFGVDIFRDRGDKVLSKKEKNAEADAVKFILPGELQEAGLLSSVLVGFSAETTMYGPGDERLLRVRTTRGTTRDGILSLSFELYYYGQGAFPLLLGPGLIQIRNFLQGECL